MYHYPEFKKMYEEKIKNNQSVINHIVKGESAKIVLNSEIKLDRPGGRRRLPNVIIKINIDIIRVKAGLDRRTILLS